jgi:CubicO group peptidase (beta-lactamase class C family)
MLKKLFLLLLLPAAIQAQSLKDSVLKIANDFDLIGGHLVVFCKNTNTQQVDYLYNIQFGKQNNATNVLMNTNSKVRIASVSKMVTAMGVMKLVEQNKLSLDQSVDSLLGFPLRNPTFPTIAITPRMLLSHKSSIVDGTGYSNFLTATTTNSSIPLLSDLLVPNGTYYTANMFNNITPGTYFNYSNINYGILGTIIEKASGLRFDVFMKQNIFIPAGLNCSYNIMDIPPADIAACYRKVNGAWAAQVDDYNGGAPSAGNLANYVVGANAVRLSPHGGLRISATELAQLMSLFATQGNLNSTNILSANSVTSITGTEWQYNSSNGNNYYGLFNKWGLGVHKTNQSTGDKVFDNTTEWWGHAGEAYGLVSDAYYNPTDNIGFALYISGCGAGYTTISSSYYTVEKAFFNAIQKVMSNGCAYPLSVDDAHGNTKQVLVANNKIILQPNEASKLVLTNLSGQVILQRELRDYLEIDLAILPANIYLLQLINQHGVVSQKVLVQ